MEPYLNVTVGADPEIFFVNARTNVPQSAEGLIGGDKQHPIPMIGLPPGFMVQEDNVSAEFNIPPAHSCEEFTKNIFDGVKYIRGIAKKNKLKLLFVPDLDFPKEQLQTKHCQTLGCDPDFNAWTDEENPSPKAPELMRTAAGHIHIGWDKPKWDQIIWLARTFDLFCTVPSILCTEPNRRRQLYGKAGACRPKPYGVECRALDNFWLPSKRYQTILYSNLMHGIDLLNNEGALLIDLIMDYAGMIINCINTHNKNDAEFLCNKFEVDTFADA